ncbi:MAG: dipeptide epimerase [Bacteriovoracaceae bacterium]|nr:dipeptide epimerase [Bacteriovoracaceae bacterium]
MDLELTPIDLPLNVVWKISRNASTEKKNFIVTIKEGGYESFSEVAPNVRYGETPEIIHQEFLEFQKLAVTDFVKALSFRPWKHSLRFALESAYLGLCAQKKNQTLAQFLGATGPLSMPTSMSVPIMEPNEVENYLKPYSRFKSLKIKVNQECAWDLVKEVHRVAPNKALRIDGNEGWSDLSEYLKFEEKLQGMNIEFIEQPFPAARKDMYLELHPKTPYIIMADESIEDTDNLDELKTMFRAVNIKLMKTGSLIKGRDFLIRARSLGLKTMVGCMVETGLGISYALHLAPWMDWADLDGFLLLKENPFPLVKEQEGIVSLS